MKRQIYCNVLLGVDSLTTALIKYDQFEELNTLCSNSFPQSFTKHGKQSLIQNFYTVPLPIRSQFVFVLLLSPPICGFGQEEIVGFGMMDTSKQPPLIQNVCRHSTIKGDGKIVLWSLEKYARSHRFPKLQLKAENQKLANYYMALGWKVVSKSPVSPYRILMEKYL